MKQQQQPQQDRSTNQSSYPMIMSSFESYMNHNSSHNSQPVQQQRSQAPVSSDQNKQLYTTYDFSSTMNNVSNCNNQNKPNNIAQQLNSSSMSPSSTLNNIPGGNNYVSQRGNDHSSPASQNRLIYHHQNIPANQINFAQSLVNSDGKLQHPIKSLSFANFGEGSNTPLYFTDENYELRQKSPTQTLVDDFIIKTSKSTHSTSNNNSTQNSRHLTRSSSTASAIKHQEDGNNVIRNERKSSSTKNKNNAISNVNKANSSGSGISINLTDFDKKSLRRANNRVAAAKCRRKKIETIMNLTSKNDKLCANLTQLSNVFSKIFAQRNFFIEQLKQCNCHVSQNPEIAQIVRDYDNGSENSMLLKQLAEMNSSVAQSAGENTDEQTREDLEASPFNDQSDASAPLDTNMIIYNNSNTANSFGLQHSIESGEAQLDDNQNIGRDF